MITSRDVVIVKVVYDEDEHVLKTYTSQYRNLMTLICDKIYVDSFGDCGGMGRCATCAVEIIESNKPLPESDRNEEATLSKSGIKGLNVRLACQLPVNQLLNDIKVKIWQQY